MTQRGRNNGRFIYRPSCELCGQDDPQILFSQDFSAGKTWDFLKTYYKGKVSRELVGGTPFEICRCPGCGFIWQSHVLAGLWLDVLYEEWISPEDSLEKENDNRRRLNRQRAVQISLIPLLLRPWETRDMKVLDFGMGWGGWCTAAKAAGFQAFGAELSPARIAYAESRGIKVIRDLSLSRHKFEYINAEQVLEHVAEPLEIVRNLVGVLRPKGLVRIGVPDGSRFLRRRFWRLWRPSNDEVHPLEHINCFTHQTLVRLGETVKLKPLSSPRLIRAMTELVMSGGANPYHAIKTLYQHIYGTGIVFEFTPH